MTMCATSNLEGVEEQLKEGQPVYVKFRRPAGQKPILHPATVFRTVGRQNFVEVVPEMTIRRRYGPGRGQYVDYEKGVVTPALPPSVIMERRDLAEPCACPCHDSPIRTISHARPCCNYVSEPRALAQLSCEDADKPENYINYRVPRIVPKSLGNRLKALWIEFAGVGSLALIALLWICAGGHH